MEKEQEILNRMNQLEDKKTVFWKTIQDRIKILVCLGDTGSGKTAMTFKILEYMDKKVYIYKHPNPKLIEAMGYHPMRSISELGRITDSVIWIDEPQLHFSRYDKKTNEFFLQLCSLARQNDNTLIFSTSDTRWINKGLESYVSHWVIKNLDMQLIKNGGMAKNIVKSVMPLAVNELNMEVNEYIFYSQKDSDYNKMHTFKKPIYFDDRLSKAYKNTSLDVIEDIFGEEKNEGKPENSESATKIPPKSRQKPEKVKPENERKTNDGSAS